MRHRFSKPVLGGVWVMMLLAASGKSSSASRLKRKSGRAGFSLIELIVVLTISSLIAVAITVNWTGSLSAASVVDTIDKLIEVDRQTRRHAIMHGRPCQFEFDFGKNRVSVSRWEGGREFFRTIQLNPKATITEIEPDVGSYTIDPNGSGPTCYFRISNAHGKHRWLFFAGGSGQHHIFVKEKDAKKFLQAIQSTGVNAG